MIVSGLGLSFLCTYPKGSASLLSLSMQDRQFNALDFDAVCRRFKSHRPHENCRLSHAINWYLSRIKLGNVRGGIKKF